MLRALKLAVLLVVAASFPAAAQPNLQKAIFAGGCFWCTESDFDKVPGVVSTVSGYIGGKTQNPTYQQIGRGGTGHAEAVEITFDPAVVSYQTLVEIYWRTIDPTDKTGQFCDRGDQYRPEIFAVDGEQKAIAEKSRQALIDAKRFRSAIEVAVTPAPKFWPAEDYHQDFHNKSPGRYYSYRVGCGRDARLEALWGKEAGGKTLVEIRKSEKSEPRPGLLGRLFGGRT